MSELPHLRQKGILCPTIHPFILLHSRSSSSLSDNTMNYHPPHPFYKPLGEAQGDKYGGKEGADGEELLRRLCIGNHNEGEENKAQILDNHPRGQSEGSEMGPGDAEGPMGADGDEIPSGANNSDGNGVLGGANMPAQALGDASEFLGGTSGSGDAMSAMAAKSSGSTQAGDAEVRAAGDTKGREANALVRRDAATPVAVGCSSGELLRANAGRPGIDAEAASIRVAGIGADGLGAPKW
ncbi:unnamed protein product [Ilex paraguariensis]|uniref:Uncharacterized protein n=1 Tax=Ilex paraguariensis TaxID=185542 RepID=A0ABC8SZB5_9AQUA